MAFDAASKPSGGSLDRVPAEIRASLPKDSGSRSPSDAPDAVLSSEDPGAGSARLQTLHASNGTSRISCAARPSLVA